MVGLASQGVMDVAGCGLPVGMMMHDHGISHLMNLLALLPQAMP